ncbi:MAG: Gfo/Idh/MocA family oxidoreductase [Bacteroidales bacterium]|nr:Gfo/Idh/MocA family oxidoreductase [Bacteroidales bacterium]MBN2634469.1 Gfo/Idh/MocA family oxidoreductase [Bacteroidales bacterium]
MKKYRWGILAPGKMSAKFTKGIQLFDNAELYAVGSRDASRAEKFAKDFGFKKYYDSYEKLAADPDVEIVYIASPHSHHREQTLLCLRKGKNVICEKAFGLNAREVNEMIREAKKQDLFLMEALWPPFQPFYKKAGEILNSGVLGKPLHLHGYFSFIPPYDPLDRKFNLDLGGGSLLDIGIYPVIDALTFLGVPAGIKASATFSPTGSEESLSAVFSYQGGEMATIYSSFRTNVGIGCDILCEKGNMTVTRGRDMSQKVILSLHGEQEQEYTFNPPAMGYHWEAEEVMRCLDEGLKESPVVPLSFSLDLIKTLDRIREAAGIRFPADDN